MQVLIGPPGAGKTKRLVDQVTYWLDSGATPDTVGLVSFTNAAVDEARSRTAQALTLSDEGLPWFRTLHSMCFRMLGCRREDLMGKREWADLSDLLGEDLEAAEPDGPPVDPSSATMVSLDQVARATCRPLRAVWDDHGGPVDWYRLTRYTTGLTEYKRAKNLMDFTDLLERVAEGQGTIPPLTHAVVDEAQDLTPLQWHVAHRVLQGVTTLVAGDDDQAVYQWAGADVGGFLELTRRYPTRQLTHSYRLPEAVAGLAQSVAERLGGRRVTKAWDAAGQGGRVDYVLRPDEIDLSQGTWLLLARTRYQLRELADIARDQGFNYSIKGKPAVEMSTVRAVQGYEMWRSGKLIPENVARIVLKALRQPTPGQLDETIGGSAYGIGPAAPIWHDALIGIPLDEREFYLTLLRRGEKLTEKPRIRIETIHGSKGLEAEHVLLPLDLTPRVQRGMEVNPDAEHRILFVGLTRARTSLTIVLGRGPYRYEL